MTIAAESATRVVREMAAQHVDIRPGNVTSATALSAIGFDDYDRRGFFRKIELVFDAEIPDSVIAKIRTVQDTIDAATGRRGGF